MLTARSREERKCSSRVGTSRIHRCRQKRPSTNPCAALARQTGIYGWVEYGPLRRIPLAPSGSLLPKTQVHWPTNPIFHPGFAERSVSPRAATNVPWKRRNPAPNDRRVQIHHRFTHRPKTCSWPALSTRNWRPAVARLDRGRHSMRSRWLIVPEYGVLSFGSCQGPEPNGIMAPGRATQPPRINGVAQERVPSPENGA